MRVLIASALVLALAGCAAFYPDELLTPADQIWRDAKGIRY